MNSSALNPIAVQFDQVSVIFGKQPQRALREMDAGRQREEIATATGHVVGVHDISLSVHRGETVVLMGLSGSGKSTLLRTVNGLNPITQGHLWVNTENRSYDLAKTNPLQLRHLRLTEIAMVFQQFALLPWRTVADNVGFGLELARIPKAKRQTRINEQLSLVHLQEWANHRVSELSGGMQQRVGLARAFATQAPILLMDEPFSALDPLIRANLQDELLTLQSRFKKTLIFVSHDLDEALKLGTHIAILEGGRLIQFGTPREIVLHPANEHVARFVAHVNPLNILRASEVMRPLDGSELIPDHQRIPQDTSMRALLHQRINNPGTLGVINTQGQLIGVIDDTVLYRALLNEPKGGK